MQDDLDPMLTTSMDHVAIHQEHIGSRVPFLNLCAPIPADDSRNSTLLSGPQDKDLSHS